MVDNDMFNMLHSELKMYDERTAQDRQVYGASGGGNAGRDLFALHSGGCASTEQQEIKTSMHESEQTERVGDYKSPVMVGCGCKTAKDVLSFIKDKKVEYAELSWGMLRFCMCTTMIHGSYTPHS